MVSGITFSSEITCVVHLSVMSCDTSVHLTSLSLIGSGWSPKCPLAVNPGKMCFDLSFVVLDMIRDYSRGEGVLSLPEGVNVCIFVSFPMC